VTAQEVGLGVHAGAGDRRPSWPSQLHLSPALRRAAYPLLVSSQAVPFVILAPLLVFWFGFSVSAKLGRSS